MLRIRPRSWSVLLSVLGSILGVAVTLALATPAFALPIGTEEDDHESLSVPPTWEEIEAAAVDFTAIVALSNCSGSLIRFTTSKTTDPAMVLTNGHCLSFLGAGDAVYKQPSTRSFNLLTSDGGSTLGTLRAAQVLYATMTGTDVTLYKLNITYAQISTRFRVAPLVLSNRRPTAGTPIRIVSGYWRRIYSCNIDRFAFQLKEAQWTWNESIRYTQPGCAVIGGTSGSPIINANTNQVIGANNTINENGERCTLNNPCEVDQRGVVTFEQGAAYAQQTYQIYSCVNSANDIDLNRPGCRLNKPLP